MQAPDRFVELLDQAFQGRLRLRWSYQRETWLVEQKVGRAALPARRFAPTDDDVIRETDGYSLVFEVRRGDRMPCRHCGRPLRVPLFEIGEVTCWDCRRPNGRDARWAAGFFELNDRLIDALRAIDPERLGPVEMRRRLTWKLDNENASLEDRQDRAYEAERHDCLFDAAVSQLPMVGYRRGAA